jgi:hypothetical protein
MARLDASSFPASPGKAIDAGRLRTGARAVIFAALCGVTAGMLLLALPRLLITQSATLKLDMQISGGSTVGLYVNRFDRAPARVNIVPGSRRIYSFGGITSDIVLFRLDVSDQIGAEIKLYGAVVDDQDGVLRRFDPAEIARWPRSEMNLVESAADVVTFVASGKNPYLLLGNAAQLRRSLPVWLTSLMADANTFRIFAPLVVAGLALMLLAAALEARRASHLVLATAITAGAIALVPWLSGMGGLEPLTRTVGRAAFFGTSARGNATAMLAVLVLSLLSALLASLFWPRIADEQIPQRRVPRLHIALGLIVVLAVVAPDLQALIRAATNHRFQPDWDGNNILTWNWLIHEGYVPLRDFWYPYGGGYLFSLPLPWGLVVRSLYVCFLYGALFLVISRLTLKPLIACAIVLFVSVGHGMGLFPGADRYLLFVLVVMSYVMDSSRRAPVLFWSFCAITSILEPVQLIYAAPPVALVLLFDVYQTRAWAPRLLAVRLARDFAVPAIFAATYIGILVFVWQGQGAIDFYRSLADTAVYAAEPADLAGAVRNPLSIQFLILIAPFTFLAIGLAERLRRAGAGVFPDTMIVLGMAGFMLLQKHLVRSIEWQLFVIVCLGFLLYLVFLWERIGLLGWAVSGSVVGGAIAVLAQMGVLTSFWNVVMATPGRVAGNFLALASPVAAFTDINARRFAADRFDFNDEKAVAADLAAHAPGGRIPRLFVLGDTPVLYVLTGQVPPYHVNDYNSSPIYEQKKLVDFVTRENPPVVVWDPNTQSFDLVQSVVRNPLTYAAVISGYVPDRRVARFEILRRRASNEPIALDFWRSKLGSTVALGHFPRASSFSTMTPCPGARPECQDFLSVTKKNPSFAGQLVVRINVDGRTFDVTMQTASGDHELYVSLDRLWFWGPLKASGLVPHLEASGTSADIDVEIKQVMRRDDILY